MVDEVIMIMGKRVRIVYDPNGNKFWHDASGAMLKFQSGSATLYRIAWNNRVEFVVLIKDADDVEAIIKVSWRCFFKILGETTDSSEDYLHLSKDIYSQAFIDTFDCITETVTHLQEQHDIPDNFDDDLNPGIYKGFTEYDNDANLFKGLVPNQESLTMNEDFIPHDDKGDNNGSNYETIRF